MALSNPRKLKMDGELYHWKVSRNGVLHFAVRKPGTPKLRMVVNFQPEEEVTITPCLVRSYIERAKAEGWTGSVKYDHKRMDKRE
jgi:hypothetical protein